VGRDVHIRSAMWAEKQKVGIAIIMDAVAIDR